MKHCFEIQLQPINIRMCGKYDPGHTALRGGVAGHSIPAWLYAAWDPFNGVVSALNQSDTNHS